LIDAACFAGYLTYASKEEFERYNSELSIQQMLE